MVIYKVVAYGRWSLTRSGRKERVDCMMDLLFKDNIFHCYIKLYKE